MTYRVFLQLWLQPPSQVSARRQVNNQLLGWCSLLQKLMRRLHVWGLFSRSEAGQIKSGRRCAAWWKRYRFWSVQSQGCVWVQVKSREHLHGEKVRPRLPPQYCFHPMPAQFCFYDLKGHFPRRVVVFRLSLTLSGGSCDTCPGQFCSFRLTPQGYLSWPDRAWVSVNAVSRLARSKR